MSSERHIELTWRCSTCTHRNLGRHMVCQSCGNPKDDSEAYEMPADPSAVASVTDPELLRMAEAGANWSCAYCSSNQRDLDGGCARCGAGRSRRSANANARVPSADYTEALPQRRTFRAAHVLVVLVVGVALLFVACCFAVGSRLNAPPVSRPAPPPIPVIRTEFAATVTAISWTRSITVEKWQLAPHEGFTADVPAGAVDVRGVGQRVHHHEDVFDHNETVYDNVEVPDGYRTETYSDRERCGEDCVTTPRTCKKSCTRSSKSCRQVCTNKNNGFASCRDVCTGGDETCRDDCSGGDRKCTTKYCSVTKTRQIPKTRTERRPRIVPKYRSEPRYAAYSTFKTWEWVTLRKVDESGTDPTPRWPDAGALAVDAGLATAQSGGPKAGAERELRSERYEVTITTEEGLDYPYTPASEEETARLQPNAKLRVRVANGTVSPL